MNDNINFWRIWPRNQKWPLFIGLFALILLVGYGMFSLYQGLENILKWNVLSELHEKIISASSFFYDDFKFSASTPVWYIKERYMPSLVEVNHTAYYIYFPVDCLVYLLFLPGFLVLRAFGF